MRRREFLAAATIAGAATNTLAISAPDARAQGSPTRWPICLDTATIRPNSLDDKVRIAAEAGYDAIEPWEGELNDYEQAGGSLKELGARIRDLGLFVPSVIGLWNAIPPTAELFERSLTDSRRRMRQASDVGAEHIQVIPQPARPRAQFDPAWAANCYRTLLEIGLGDYDINPAVVFVDFLEGSKTLGLASQIAIDADHPNAKVIPDAFHMLIGGSGFRGLKHLQGDFIAIFQFNDAPATPAPDQLEDKHRVYPGDGILPLKQVIRDLDAIGYRACISVELYNPDYWAQDPLHVAQTALAKTMAVIHEATAG